MASPLASPFARPQPSPSNLQLRLATAAVGLPVVVGLIWIGGWIFALAAGVIALLAAAEFVRGWLMPSMPLSSVWPQATAFGGAAVMVAGAHWSAGFLVVGLAVAVVFALLGYSRLLRYSPRKPYRVLAWCFVYVGALLATMVLLRDAEHGRAWVFLGILATFATDTGAYVVGRAIGRHKLAPAISPGKTIEGAVAGVVAGAGAVLALNAAFDTGVSAATVAPFAVVLPVAAQAGDLLESWMKRRMGIKDASNLLPGHGGFLDRLDSVLLVMPLLYVFVQLAT
jgi:phosphatidate cytidylyltransferase